MTASCRVNAISCAALAPASRKCAPGDRDRVVARHLVGAELDRVGDQADRRRGRPDPRAARDVLLEDVVLDRAAQLLARHALLVADRDVEGEHDRGGAVDRPRRRDLVERDVAEEDLGVGERVERDADPADLLFDVGVVGVVADLGRAGRRPPRGRCHPAPAGAGSARSTTRRCRSPSTAGTSRAGRGSHPGGCRG